MSNNKLYFKGVFITNYYDVMLDISINPKQIIMFRKKIKLPKILSEEELKVFFYACEIPNTRQY